MDRRQIRYFLRRIKTSVETRLDPDTKIIKLPKLPVGFRKSFESQPKFRGWMGYQVTWDVDDSGWNIVMLNVSLEEEWNRTLEMVVPELPKQLAVIH